MKPEITLDELPKPGEPLTPKIHEANQKLLDEEIQARAVRVRAKLTQRQIAQLNKRYKVLHKQLNRGKWNDLCKERWELYQSYQQLRHALKTATGKKKIAIEARIRDMKARGKPLDAAVKQMRPLAAEFQTIIDRLKAHADVLAWEKEDKENKDAFAKEARAWQEQMKAVCRQSARLHHAWDDTNGKRRTDIPDFSRIIFKDDKVLFHIKVSTQNPIQRLFGRWSSKLPYNVDIADLTSDETLENLSAATGRVVTVERSQNGVNLFWSISRLDSPDGIPQKYPYEKVLDYYPSGDHSKTPWAAGVSGDRKIKWFNFEDNPHVLVAGTTLSGKSNHVNQMLATMFSMNTPAELRVVLIDNKGGVEFTHWKAVKHLLIPMVKTANKVPEALKYIRSIMERRLAMFEAIGAKNLASYNEKAKEKIPRIITVIDEMATLVGLGDITADIHTELRAISAQGRAAGVHLILCTQHPSVDVIPGWIKTNMGVRIAGKMPNHQASQIILDTVTAATLPSHPGRLVFSLGRNEIIAQSPFISDASIAAAVAFSQEYPDADNDEFNTAKPVVIPKRIFDEEDAIEMALTLLDGKLSPTAIFKKIGSEVMSERDVRDMIDDIIERGIQHGIYHKGVQYKPRKIRKFFLLEAVGQAVGQSMPENTDETEASYCPIEEVPA